MTFRHLANMISGYALPEDPGTHWGYNDYAIMLYNKTLFERAFKQKPDPVVRGGTPRTAPVSGRRVVRHRARRVRLVTSPRDFARIGWF